MSENETLRQQLLYAPKNGYDRLSETDRAAMRAYCQDYMHFLDAAKTEREAVTETIRMAEGAGFTAYTPGMRLKPGTQNLLEQPPQERPLRRHRQALPGRRRAHLRRPYRLPPSGPQTKPHV